MIGRVFVMEEEDYQNWLGGDASGESMLEAGERQFQQLGCTTCHKNDTSGRGPTLIGAYGKTEKMDSGEEILVDEDYVRESILDPQARIVNGFKPVMPTYQGQISEETLLQLLTYIKSLGESEK
jgi:cytochrome c oxidase subunit 2